MLEHEMSIKDNNLAGQAQSPARDVLVHETTKAIGSTPSFDDRVGEREHGE